LLAILLIALLAAFVLAQRYLSRTTHRTFNVPLLAATFGTVLLALGAGGVLIAQRAQLSDADQHGSRPVALLAETRIAALRERGDEALTLAARAGEGPLEQDFDRTAGELDGLLTDAGRRMPDGAAGRAIRSAIARHRAYLDGHDRVREFDNGGQYDDAVGLAIGADTSRTFAGLTSEIGRALEDRKSRFGDEIGAAGRGLGPLAVLGPLLALLCCGLAYAGLRARLEEYR
jgi:hypothetical protein